MFWKPEYLALGGTDIVCVYFISGVYVTRRLSKALWSAMPVSFNYTHTGGEFACSQLTSLGRPAGEEE